MKEKCIVRIKVIGSGDAFLWFKRVERNLR